MLCFCQICRFLFFFLHKPFQKQNNSTQQHNLNKDDTNDKINTNDKLCNCRKEPCPLNNQCLISNIICKATITTDKTTNKYLGSTGIALNKDTETTNLHLITLTKDTQQNYQTIFET